jgi:uncharacterized protein YndB with AHSA1/START domain
MSELGIASVVIDASASAVWRVILDGPGYARWHPRLEWLFFEGAGAPGTIVTVKPKRGRQTAFVVRDAVPDRLLVLETGIGPAMRLTVTVSLAPADDPAATRVTAATKATGVFAGLGRRYGGGAIAAGMDGDLHALRDVVVGDDSFVG